MFVENGARLGLFRYDEGKNPPEVETRNNLPAFAPTYLPLVSIRDNAKILYYGHMSGQLQIHIDTYKE